MRPNHTTLPFLFNLLAFVLASLLGAAAAFAQPGCMGGTFTDTDTDVDDDDDGLIDICTLAGLNAVRHNLAGTSYKALSDAEGVQCGSGTSSDTPCEGYELVKDLDFEDEDDAGYDVAWTAGDGGEGWQRMGDLSSTGFTGVLEGNGHEIRNLYINYAGGYTGLFSILGGGSEVRNLSLRGLNVAGKFNVGTLASVSVGGSRIIGCNFTGSVVAIEDNILGQVGGMVATSRGTVIDCHASVSITGAMGAEILGGLIGSNSGTITRCSAEGTVSGSGHNYGGLVGKNSGVLISCSATGNVSSSSDGSIGGLVGNLDGGEINNSYSTGNVSGTSRVGGLVGWQSQAGASISDSYSTGSATGTGDNVGGLVGNFRAGTISTSYSAGAVSGVGSNVGGLAGNSQGTVTLSYWENAGTAIDDATDDTDKTQEEMKALTSTDFGTNSGFSWDFGDATQYPALKSYKDDGEATPMQVEGDVIGGQPCPRALCYFVGGTGTDEDPYQISSVEGLNAIRGDFLDDHYILMNDLDFEDTDGSGADYVYSDNDDENAKGWLPIGHDTDKDVTGFQGTKFTGTFNGGGNVIRSLMISRDSEDSVGLFGRIAGTGSVKDLGLEDVTVVGRGNVGGLSGSNEGTITSCYSTGSVTGRRGIGGFLGSNAAGATVTSCYSTASVVGRGSGTGAGNDAGGFVGNNHGGTITSSYSTGSVRGRSSVGGFVGQAAGNITSCYSTGSVTGNSSVGGFMGTNFGSTTTSCYSTGSVTGNSSVGGFMGLGLSGMAALSFWDTDTSGFTMSAGGEGVVGKNTAEMKALTGAEDSSGWGELSWDFGNSDQYPALRTHKVNETNVQVQGDVIAGQPCPRVECGPLVSIAAGTSPVTEGTAAEFTLTRTGSTAAELTVAVTVTDPDGFLSEAAPTEAVFGAGDATVTLSLATAADEVDEADGTVTVTIPASASTYRLETATATVDIADDDLPLVSIEAGTSPVTEGTAAEFTLTRVGDTTAALTVMVAVTDPDSFLSGTAPTEAVFAVGDATVTLSLATAVDEVDEADGAVMVTITADASNFRLGDAAASVAVEDDDLPLVSIAAGTASVTEGTAAEFTVTRVGDTTTALTVTVAVTDPDGFLSEAAPTEVSFGDGDATVTLSLTTEGDDMDEEDGTVTATVTVAVASYRVDTAVSASVAVTDDDLPSITSFEIEGSSGSIAEDADPKTISVAVAEGTSLADLDPTVVTVRSDATVAPAGAVTFVDGIAQDFTVTAGGDTVTYQVTVNVVAGTPPGVPGGFSTVAGVEQVTLSWTAPTDLGSTLMLSKYEYQQTQGVDVSPWKAVEPATALTQVVGSLTADVVYGFEVRAVGSNGLAGEPTAKQEATPLAVGGLTFMGTIANQTYTKNTAITDLELPVATGGMGPYMYTLVPVPAGLMFDATTRTLSGMPTAVTPTPTTHTYTVTDNTADTALTESMTFTITVNEEGSPTFADTVANQTYTENTVITDLVLPVATGGMGSLTYALTPVPDGLEFDATNRTLSGTPTIPTPTPTTHTYTVTDSTPVTALTAALTFTITVSEEAETTFGIGSLGAAVHVYPNPVGDVLHIEFAGAGDYGIALLTVTGQPVFGGQHAGGGTKKLDVSTLKGGVYFLKIEDSEGGSHTVRIIL